MDRVLGISKEQMLDFLNKGYTNRKISELTGVSKSQVGYIVRRYGLQYMYNKPKYDAFYLNSIETKEMAYILGFIIADGYISNDELVDLRIAIEDAELMDFIAKSLGCIPRVSTITNRSKRRFPRIGITRKIRGIHKFTAGLKKGRNVPIVSRDLEVYMLRGIFDADGCITWGRRKDRNRVWHKVCFNSSLSILTAVQKILYKIGISTIVRPKVDEDCFVLEFANRPDVLTFYDYLYSDTSFIPLKRKFNKYNALRLELGEIRETTDNGTILSEATDLSVERAETTGELNGALNDQTSAQGFNELRYSPNGGIDDKYDL